MSISKIYIYLDKKPKPPKDLDLSSQLITIKEQIKNIFSMKFVFMSGNDELPLTDEKDWKLQDVINDEKDKKLLYLKTKIIHTQVDDFAAPVNN